MTIPPGFARELALLSRALDGPEGDGTHGAGPLAVAVTSLEASAVDSVRSYLGLSVALHEPPSALWPGPAPIVLTTLRSRDDGSSDLAIGSSLLLPLHLPAPAPPGTTAWRVDIVLYAASAGAFVDLAADLAWLTGTPLSAVELDRNRSPELATGLRRRAFARASVVDQAVGALIAGGLTPDQSVADLAHRAARAGVDLVAAAEKVLDEL